MRTQNARLERCKSQTDPLPDGLISLHGVFGGVKGSSVLLQDTQLAVYRPNLQTKNLAINGYRWMFSNGATVNPARISGPAA